MCKIYPYTLYINAWGLVYIKKFDLFCCNTQMSSTLTPHLKITSSTSPHLPLHYPAPKIPLFLFEINFVPTLHYPHQIPNKINTLPQTLYHSKNPKNIRTRPAINVKTSKTYPNSISFTNFPELLFKIKTPH